MTNLNEDKRIISPDMYGGWITPDNKIEYVSYEEHLSHLRAVFKMSPKEAFQKGFVKFSTSVLPGSRLDISNQALQLEGQRSALIKSRSVWMPLAASGMTVIIDVRDNEGFSSGDHKILRSASKRDIMGFMREHLDFEDDILVEKVLDISEYGGWIEPHGEIHYVKDVMGHLEFASDIQDKEASDEDVENYISPYEFLYSRGWIRFVTTFRAGDFTLFISGKEGSLIDNFKFWFPSIKDYSSVIVDVHKTNDETESLEYDLPKDRGKLRERFKKRDFKRDYVDEDSILDNDFFDDIFDKKKIRTGFTNNDYRLTLYKQAVSSVINNAGEVEWKENIKPLKRIEKVKFKDLPKFQNELEGLSSRLKARLKDEDSGWTDFFVHIDREDLNEALGSSKMLKVGKWLVDMVPSWYYAKANGKKYKLVKWEIHLDGKDIGYIIRLNDKKFKTKIDTFETIEEAIADLIDQSGMTTHPGISPSYGNYLNAFYNVIRKYSDNKFFR